MKLDISLVDTDAVLPTYGRDGDAGLDLYCNDDYHSLHEKGGRALVSTGVSVAIPEGYAGFVLPRSGLAAKYGISVVNSPGLIDSGYRGEIKVILVNTDAFDDYEVKRGDRIAQLVIQKVETIEWNVVEDLDETERGSGGIGHTGT